MPEPPRQIDSRIDIVTPENIAFHYVLAGPFRRLPAYLIDVGIRIVFLMALFLSKELRAAMERRSDATLRAHLAEAQARRAEWFRSLV